MAYVKDLYDLSFLEYASYVIKDRAIPYVEDGLKPVQRRILHTLFKMDDGKFHKVANVVGQTMKFHPHGDASIFEALVVLANKNLFIEKQGNFGNIYTGDGAAAGRYIECRITPLAKEILYNPEITQFEPNYDGREDEPMYFPAKIPVALVLGAKGIAVGMATEILPHNFHEVLSALKSALRNEPFELYPDFQTGGYIDVSDYKDGVGKILSRAKIEVIDDKTVVIKEIPCDITTDLLIKSIDEAAKKNKIMVSKITDFTSEKVEIEIKLKRGFYASEIIDAFYAFTDCEKSVSVNSLLIKQNHPVVMTVSEVVKDSAEQLKEILEAELNLEKYSLTQKLHLRTIERIFVVERIYKKIEEMKTQKEINNSVKDGFIPFTEEVGREITDDDVERLLQIPIRRISLYDIEKNKKEISDIKKRLSEIEKLLKNIVGYAIDWVENLDKKYGHLYPRKTEILEMDRVSAKDVAIRDKDLRYNGNNGYLGYELKEGPIRCKVSVYDKIIYIDKNGTYKVIDVPEKIFVGYRVRFIELAEVAATNVVFTALYKNSDGVLYIKRFKIEKTMNNKEYSILPDKNCELLELTTEADGTFIVNLVYIPKMKKTAEHCKIPDYSIKGVSARGYKITDKAIDGIEWKKNV
ncbi:MAG: DNA topoisomerase IV subunit A [Chitinispirillales bacterium]|jgi:topoisomerase-4 subunit A|nr:DNA topoisomerase IV subunit A [Chitinispirillales bacterium]